MGERENFPNQPCTTMQCTISFQMSMQTIIIKGLFSMCLFQYFNKLKNLIFQCFLKDKNNVFERKDYCSLSKKNSHYINEKQKSNHKEQAITTQSTLSMKAKTKSKPISLLNANENVLSNQ
jgi:hypothetical protein